MKNILTDYFKGRGAQFNPHNKFIKNNNNYVAGVVHDLRNPLTEIYSCTELLTQTLPEHLLNNPDML